MCVNVYRHAEDTVMHGTTDPGYIVHILLMLGFCMSNAGLSFETDHSKTRLGMASLVSA